MDIFLGRTNQGSLDLDIDGVPVAVSGYDKIVMTLIPVRGGANFQIDSEIHTGTIDHATDGELKLTLGEYLESVNAEAQQYHVEAVGILNSKPEQLVSREKDCVTFDVYQPVAVTF